MSKIPNKNTCELALLLIPSFANSNSTIRGLSATYLLSPKGLRAEEMPHQVARIVSPNQAAIWSALWNEPAVLDGGKAGFPGQPPLPDKSGTMRALQHTLLLGGCSGGRSLT